jgi:hypothetical protein
VKHGTAGGYRFYRCTCVPCREANRVDRQARRHNRMARRDLVAGRWVAPVPEAMHGKAGTYKEWMCRCPRCTEAHRLYTAAARARRRERDRLRAPGALGWR